MKKIFVSLAVVALAAAAVIGGSGAFFNDTETSTGNILTAGSIDLKVDHLRQTYNGVDCETCSLTLYSDDLNTDVVDSSANASVQGSFPYPAPEVSNPHPNWATHGTADWIWAQESTSQNDATTEVEYTFERTFYWNGVAGSINFEMALGSDNGYAIYLNSTLLVDNLDSEYNYNATFDPLSGQEAAFLSAVQLGENTLTIIVRNHEPDGWQGTPQTNPGGLLYYLNIQREECEADSEFLEYCRLWNEKDLDEGDHFFYFSDVKPGDWGTNLISLHVYDNDAWACLATDGVDNDNGLTEPEEDAGDSTGGLGEGELSPQTNILLWLDDENGDYDGEDFLYNGTLADLDLAAIFDSTTGNGYLNGTTTEYLSLAWCAGEFDITEGDELVCLGTMDDTAQSDSYIGDLILYTEQVRNNSDFTCEGYLNGEPTQGVQDE